MSGLNALGVYVAGFIVILLLHKIYILVKWGKVGDCQGKEEDIALGLMVAVAWPISWLVLVVVTLVGGLVELVFKFMRG